MKWRIWITRWIRFYIRYLRLFWIYVKKHGEKVVNPSIRIYINEIENRITFKIKTGYYLELESTKSEITKNENGENPFNLEIAEVVLIHCNIDNNNYQRNSRVLYTFVPNKSFCQLLSIYIIFYILKNFWFRIFI